MFRFASQYSFLIFVVALMLAIGFMQVFLLWAFNRPFWKKTWVRWGSWSLPVLGILAMSMWGLGEFRQIDWLAKPGMVLSALVILVEFALLLTLPISGLFHLANRGLDYLVRHRHTDTAIDSNRRIVLKGVAAAVPILAVASAGTGFAESFGTVRVYTKTLLLDDLPPDLEGYRILHLSDLHLREYTTLDTLEDVLGRAREFDPQLVLVTGDIADDLEQLPGALRMVEQFGAPHGYFASLGNHEYFRGIASVHRIFDKSTVPLFVNQGQRLTVGSTSVFVAGIDDPRRLGAKETSFYKRTIDTVLHERRRNEFMILMTHRPDALDYASKHDINLLLAGHTHGGQVGFGGRSIFESYWEDRYLWGDYRRENSVLYTSSGVGHWFPFRLGCPPEAPVIELRRRVN